MLKIPSFSIGEGYSENDHFDVVKGDADTLGGLIMEISQSIPSRGDEVLAPSFRFIVESADRRRIKRVKVIRMEEERDSEDNEE